MNGFEPNEPLPIKWPFPGPPPQPAGGQQQQGGSGSRENEKDEEPRELEGETIDVVADTLTGIAKSTVNAHQEALQRTASLMIAAGHWYWRSILRPVLEHAQLIQKTPPINDQPGPRPGPVQGPPIAPDLSRKRNEQPKPSASDPERDVSSEPSGKIDAPSDAQAAGVLVDGAAESATPSPPDIQGNDSETSTRPTPARSPEEPELRRGFRYRHLATDDSVTGVRRPREVEEARRTARQRDARLNERSSTRLRTRPWWPDLQQLADTSPLLAAAPPIESKPKKAAPQVRSMRDLVPLFPQESDNDGYLIEIEGATYSVQKSEHEPWWTIDKVAKPRPPTATAALEAVTEGRSTGAGLRSPRVVIKHAELATDFFNVINSEPFAPLLEMLVTDPGLRIEIDYFDSGGQSKGHTIPNGAKSFKIILDPKEITSSENPNPRHVSSSLAHELGHVIAFRTMFEGVDPRQVARTPAMRDRAQEFAYDKQDAFGATRNWPPCSYRGPDPGLPHFLDPAMTPK